MAKEILDSEDDGGDDDDHHHRGDGQDVGGLQSLISASAEPPGVFIPRPTSTELICARNDDCHLGPS